MATTVKYKNSNITSLKDGDTKKLNTAGTWVEDDITISESLNLQSKTITPSSSQQTITADTGYEGLSSVTVGAVPEAGAITVTEEVLPDGGVAKHIVGVDISNDTVTSARLLSPYTAHDASGNEVTGAIATRTASNMSVSGATVTASAGYYASNTSKSVASGTATAPTSISGTSATVSTGTNTLTLSKTVSVTPRITTAGYISSGTAGNASVSLTANVTTKGAATYTPSTSTQTIASGQYLTGTQTINPIPSQYIVPSGTLTIDENGTHDVTNYASVNVDVSGGTNAPTFTLNYDSNGNVQSVTCDKTYAECVDIIDGGTEYAIVNRVIPNDGTYPTSFGLQSVGTYIVYVNNASASYSEAIQYSSNGTINYLPQSPAITTLTATANGTYTDNQYRLYSSVTVNVPSGASNIVQGTFTTSSTGGATQSISIPYSGNGYPISWTIEPTGGFYGNTDFYNLIQRYVTVIYCGIKADINTLPVWSDSGVTANQSGADVVFMYKNSTSNNLPVAYTGGTPIVYTGKETAYGNQSQVIFKNATTMCIYVASTAYGFAPNIEYTYRIVYSE